MLGASALLAAGTTNAAGNDAAKRPTNTFTMIVNAPPAPAVGSSWSHAPLPSSSRATSSASRESATSVPLLRGAGTLSMSR